MSSPTSTHSVNTQPDTGPNVALTFAYEEPSHCLSVLITSSNQSLSLDLESLKVLIKSQGFGEMVIEDKTLMELLTQVHAGKEGALLLSGSAEHTKIQLAINPKSHKLVAQLIPSSQAVTYTIESLHTLAEKKGYGEYKLDDMAIEDVLKIKAKNDYGEYVIGNAAQTSTVKHVAIQYEYNDKTRQLLADIIETDNISTYTFAAIQDELKTLGYEDYGVTNKIISDLINRISRKKYGRYVIGEKPQYTHVDFIFDEKSGDLFAELSASEHDQKILPPWINQTLKEKNLDNLFFEPNSLKKLFRQIQKNERGRFIIGKRKDASAKIECDNELMHAYITLIPPFGGNELNEEILKEVLTTAGIVQPCCDQAILKNILIKKPAEKILFASGIDKKEGTVTKFEALVEEVMHIPLKENKTGQVDFRDALHFTQVEPDVQLMRRYPAVPGINGQNVKGQAIPALQIDDIPFNQNLMGVSISEEDPNILISNIKGHPVILNDGVRVDEVIVVNNVDISTGNIDYDGSIMVKGEVMPGMKICVTGDIVVRGVVRKATLNAKNNITIYCGVIGSDSSKDPNDSPPAILKAGGDITAQYVSQAKLTAMQDIIVREYISHCHCEAKHQIIVGQAGGKGRIFGGDCHANTGIIATHIGTDSGLKTHISVGIPPKLYKQFEHLEHSFKHRIEQRDKLKKVLKDTLENAKEDLKNTNLLTKIKNIKQLLNQTQIEINKMDETVKNIKQNFKESRHAEIIITKGTFSNIFITINGADFLVRQESKGGKFIKQGKDIRWMV